MVLVFQQLFVLDFDFVFSLQSLIPSLEVDFVLVASIFHMGIHFFIPVDDFMLVFSSGEVVADAAVPLSVESFTFEARAASCLIISIYRSTFRI